ncbi:asparagine synthase (glutamine-hydrolyzing) [Christiangramia forsetii]|uniref:asparagine synthase (glutamine-hydrolyzing) n=2 Tax=Christiangramia forsetii TaxID=411153 RepID=A0M2W8_CHRFK|nr:asparagine synthase (glutamine-hydrolyzing) [Christiangramia forsetii]GGG27358.1 asparagine synthetase B [Christiangramia forsetii]CAL66963.1 asparagine synthetase [glutamine-hydrolyzing] [Christiangramia forsetii KT0803]
MCGINGFITKGKISSEDLREHLEGMNNKIIHRGPDQDGFFIESNQNFSVAMAMRRLSIIDLGTGTQPIFNKTGEILIFFNGEIYNYLELKNTLQQKNHIFKTTSDTEVILKAYEEWGTESFGMLDGMFAFSIYDKTKNKVFIARDYFGEKPLYYSKTGNQIIWGSELKSIVQKIDWKPQISKEGLNLYFRLTYIPAPYSIYEKIYKLEANHYIELTLDTFQQEIFPIQNKQSISVDKGISFKEAKSKTHDLVFDSVKSRSIADVPLGTFLSGGVDSSVVSLALSQQVQGKIDTFSVGFEKKSFDETDKSRTVANLINSNHHEFIISASDLKENLDEILLNFDEPFADSSSLPTYLVANKTRQHVKVALTGDGGDEIFGGYNKYYIGKMNEQYSAIISKSLHDNLKKIANKILSTKDDRRGNRFKARKLINAVNYEGDFYYNIISLAFQNEDLSQLLKAKWLKSEIFNPYKTKTHDKASSLTDFRRIDKILSLEGDMLVKVDRTSMLTSLESRAPFLNKKLWDFTSQLPESYLMKGWDKKFILKEAFKDYFPKQFLNKSKKGFGVPVGDWLRGYLKSELESYAEEDFLERQNLFHKEFIQKLVGYHLSGKQDNTFKVWAFFCFQKWYKETYLNF